MPTPQVQTFLVGTAPEKLWMPAGAASPDPDEALLCLQELAHELKRRGVIDRSRKILYEWAVRGRFDTTGSNRQLIMRSRLVGRTRHSSVLWVKEFLAGLNGEPVDVMEIAARGE